MPIKINPRKEQLKDLATLRDLGTETIELIIDKLSGLDSAIKPSDIEQALNSVLQDSPDKIKSLMNVLMSLITLRKQRNLSVEELFAGLQDGIVRSGDWSEEEIARWANLKEHVLNLFSLPTVETVVKALDLSYDYANLLKNAKILTDIRPVFNKEASLIQGAVVSYTLRVYFTTLEGRSESISLALNEQDVETLRRTCDRALKKAQTAKKFMLGNNIKATFITGEEEL